MHKRQQIGSLTLSIDPSVPAVYVYLREREGFRSYNTVVIDDDVNVDLDAEGNVIGVEMLGPGSLEVVLNIVVPRYHLDELKELSARKKIFEDVFQPAETA
ncbi:MAG: DUF2283 domain-containing protein [Planctomycetota bacterium]